jgi:hypothetical protein
MTERRYLLKIKLAEIEPDIWRQFVVPADITLDRLHDVIQVVMGWTDSHLYEFLIGNRRYTELPEFEEDGLEAGKYRLGDLLDQKGGAFDYRYDFGDNWLHIITIEDDRYENPALVSEIECLDGARACPPEDIGGVFGYDEFCDAVNNPDHEEHEHIRQWYGEPYDSDAFSTDDLNDALMIYLRWSRDRCLPWGKTGA